MPHGEGKNPSYEWLVNGEKAGTNNSTFMSALHNQDVVTCKVTNNEGCAPITSLASNEITIKQIEDTHLSVIITAVPGEAVKEGELVTFKAIVPSNLPGLPNYQWHVNGKNVGADNSVFASNTLQNGNIITCTLSLNGKCIIPSSVLSNSITLIVLNNGAIIPPNAFTPNNDGYNDVWNIKELLTNPLCKVTVFNRYGQTVYQSTGYSHAWDGTSQGKPLPTGTYYYIIDPKNGNATTSGPVTIIR